MSENRKLAAVVGAPIAHSLSPFIHTEWLRRAGVDGDYQRIEIPAGYEAFEAAIDRLRNSGFAGVNVTLPHKENALRYADVKRETADRVGAANMLTFTEDGAVADNSDVYGIMESLRASGATASTGKTALVLGAGGASRGVIEGLQRLGFGDIAVANRTMAKAEAVAKTFGATVIDWRDRHTALRGGGLLINTTSLGMVGSAPLEIDLETLADDAIVADIVYAPLETDLLKQARARGLKTVDGLAMLMHQAVPGFRLWFGADGVVDDALRSLLVGILKERSRS